MTTPFEKYLQESDYPAPGYDHAYGRVEIQLPQFMYTGPPALAHGGGAEVLPVGTFNHTDSIAASWFTNTTGLSPDSAYLSSSLRAYGAPVPIPIPVPVPVPVVPPPVPPGPIPPGPGPEAPGPTPHFDAHHSDRVSHPPPPPLPLPIIGGGVDENEGYYLDYYYYADAREGEGEEEEESVEAAVEEALAPAVLGGVGGVGVGRGGGGGGGGGMVYYSSSGFDVLSLLARVATRPRPRVHLGPVDLTCSFVVVDVRRHDAPIVYCSPSFCRMTGYNEAEVLGRNCRFLQSPTGQVARGEARRYTSEAAVAYLKRQLAADKECQTRIVNYRKGGAPFVNLVTVIPVSAGWEEEEVVYHVGFQVDLSEQNVWRMPPVQPAAAAAAVGVGVGVGVGPGLGQLGQLGLGLVQGGKKLSTVGHQPFISKTLKKLLGDPEFVRSIPISSATTVPVAGGVVVVDSKTTSEGDRCSSSSSSSSWLSLMLLETCPDFVHVVSLKGSFLYVGPSVRRVLGYEPEEMVGGSIADLAHPEDVVPLMRELKESSSTGGSSSTSGVLSSSSSSSMLFGQEEQTHASMAPRTVDLLFRARTKGGVYVWVECRGRLFVEPGKGRKAIILSGRAREMPRLGWETVRYAGRREFWCLVGGQGTFVAVGSGVKEVLGWNGCELVGRRVGSVVEEWREGAEPLVGMVSASRLRRADGGSESGHVVVYQSSKPMASSNSSSSISPWPLICQIQLDGGDLLLRPLDRDGNVFAELETSRGSSWQYELQQLRFANQRLGEAVTQLGVGRRVSGMKRSWESMVTT